jgi:hypothetical protein
LSWTEVKASAGKGDRTQPNRGFTTYYNVSPILFAFDIWTQPYAEFLKREFSYGSYTLSTHTFPQGRATASYGFHHTCITTF